VLVISVCYDRAGNAPGNGRPHHERCAAWDMAYAFGVWGRRALLFFYLCGRANHGHDVQLIAGTPQQVTKGSTQNKINNLYGILAALAAVSSGSAERGNY